MPPPDVPADFLARVNARIDETAGWFGLADFRLWTLRLAPAVAALALIAVLWSGGSSSSATGGSAPRIFVAGRELQSGLRDRLAAGSERRRAARGGAPSGTGRRACPIAARESGSRCSCSPCSVSAGAGGFVLGRHVPPPPGGPGLFGGRGGPGRGGPPLFGARTGRSASLAARHRQSPHLRAAARRRAAEQIKKILDEHRDHLDTVHREARERFDTEQRELHAALRAVLRQDQQAKFDKFLDRRP